MSIGRKGTIKANHVFQYSGGYLICTACGYEKPYELLDGED